jgi:hypothetical protein
MNQFVEISLYVVNVLCEQVIPFLASLMDSGASFLHTLSFAPDPSLLSATGSGLAVDPGTIPITDFGLAFAAGPLPDPEGAMEDGVRSASRKWHGSQTDRFSNINTVTNLLKEHGDDWKVPEEMGTQLTTWRNRLQTLIDVGNSNDASTNFRMERDTLFKQAVSYCLKKVKPWAIGQVSAGVLTLDNLHRLCFLMPGESGGKRSRAEATDVMPAIKAHALNADYIRVVIDQSEGENAAKVASGWPTGVHNAVIVVTDAETQEDIITQPTTRLHNDIKLPKGSHGKAFVVRAAFLRHIDDDPKFGAQVTVTMPRTTIDLLAERGKQEN